MPLQPKRVSTAKAGTIDLSQPSMSGAEDQITSASGPWGEVYFRQLAADGIPVLFHCLRFTTADKVTYSNATPAIRLQISLERSISFSIEGLGSRILHERGLSLYYAPSVEWSMQAEAGQMHRLLIMRFTPEDLEPLQESLPSLGGFLERVRSGQAVIFNPSYCIADAELMALTKKLADCPYTGKARARWLRSVANETLVLALVQMNEASSHHPTPADGEARLVYHAKEILLKDLDKMISLPSLAQRMSLSAYKLNNYFRSVLGMGVMEWLLETRMTRAHKRLEETDDTVAEVAYQSGYAHPHSFTLAFKKYFGYTPAFVQKNGKRV